MLIYLIDFIMMFPFPLPGRCDCYILKDILQNWSDEDAAIILSNLKGVIEKDHRILLIETIMHTGSFSEERVRVVDC